MPENASAFIRYLIDPRALSYQRFGLARRLIDRQNYFIFKIYRLKTDCGRTVMADATTTPLKGRHALVTGASRGIGLAICRELARLGADITLSARDQNDLQPIARELAESHGVATAALAADLSQAEAAAGLAAQAAEQRGPVELLINNAGIAPSAPFGRQTLADLRQALEINVAAPFQLCQAVLPAMREAGVGRIVNIASTSGLIAYPYTASYVTSKHALIGLTRALALEFAKSGITVNAVCPGFTDTDIAAGAVKNIMAAGKTEAEAMALLTGSNPQGRLVEAAEVAETVGWLCLPSCGAVTGQSIVVAGGEVM